mmetsp:Transcript_65523/g.147854  ORF Transcript_65523/g.147854 Transcript_65523/m.147854 type:complete len:216 (-) Transcript_65523:159-806(-)
MVAASSTAGLPRHTTWVARPPRPARAVRPRRCRCWTTLVAKSACTTCSTPGRSSPRAARSVHTKTRPPWKPPPGEASEAGEESAGGAAWKAERLASRSAPLTSLWYSSAKGGCCCAPPSSAAAGSETCLLRNAAPVTADWAVLQKTMVLGGSLPWAWACSSSRSSSEATETHLSVSSTSSQNWSRLGCVQWSRSFSTRTAFGKHFRTNSSTDFRP